MASGFVYFILLTIDTFQFVCAVTALILKVDSNSFSDWFMLVPKS